MRWRGTATVELALTSPILILLALGSIELAREASVRQTLADAARAACRVYAADGGNNEKATTIAQSVLMSAGIAKFKLRFPAKPRDDMANGEPVTVGIDVEYNNIAWIKFLKIRNGQTLQANSTFPAEVRSP